MAAVGQSLLPRAADDLQQALSIGPRSWLGAPVVGGALRTALEPIRLELQLCDRIVLPVAALALEGRTLAEGLAFLAAELERRGQPASVLALPAGAARARCPRATRTGDGLLLLRARSGPRLKRLTNCTHPRRFCTTSSGSLRSARGRKAEGQSLTLL